MSAFATAQYAAEQQAQHMELTGELNAPILSGRKAKISYASLLRQIYSKNISAVPAAVR